MGGNIFKNTVRLNNKEFNFWKDTIESQIYFILTEGSSGPQFTTYVPAAFKDKETHGDLDIVITERDPQTYGELKDPGYITDLIAAHLGVTDFSLNFEKRNNGVGNSEIGTISFPYPLPNGKFFQVDLVYLRNSKNNVEFAVNYYSYNDLGNLIGVIAKSMTNFKFGHKGLFYRLHDSDGKFIKEVEVTGDFTHALKFLGYRNNPLQYGSNILTKEEMFEFVIKSTFFNPENYKLSSRNNANRIRDVKRKTYMDFLEWLKDKDFIPPTPTDHYKRMLKEFPYMTDKLDAIRWRHHEGKLKRQERLASVQKLINAGKHVERNLFSRSNK